jgi:hypothetical protein
MPVPADDDEWTAWLYSNDGAWREIPDPIAGAGGSPDAVRAKCAEAGYAEADGQPFLHPACHARGSGLGAGFELWTRRKPPQCLIRPSKKIARLARHASSRTTEVVYRKELRPVITTGAEAMDKIFGSKDGDT